MALPVGHTVGPYEIVSHIGSGGMGDVYKARAKRLLQTIGEPNVHASDDKHFYRPTFIAWLPDGTFFVADGYANTRVVKFDKNGNYLMAWREKGNPPVM